MQQQIISRWLILIVILIGCMSLPGCIPGTSAKISIKEVAGDKEQLLNDVQKVVEDLGYQRAPIVSPIDSSQTTLRVDAPTAVLIAFETGSIKGLRVWVEFKIGNSELEIRFTQISDSFTVGAKERYLELVHALENHFGKNHVVAEGVSNKQN